MNLPDIPKTYLIAGLILSLVILRFFNIDSFTTAGLAAIIGYLTGQHIERTKE